MIELNEISTIFINFLTPFGADENKGKNNFYAIDIIYVVFTVTINIGTFLRPFFGK